MSAPDAAAPQCILRDSWVQVWRLDLDRAAPPEAGELAPAELARAAQLSRSEDRRRWLVSRAWLRRLLGRHVGRPAGSLAIHLGEHGKPLLAGGPEFNLSHSGAAWLCAISTGPAVGIDIEAIADVPEAAAIAERCFTAAERLAMAADSDPRPGCAFLRCWVRHEAYLKALGCGLSDSVPAAEPPGWRRRYLDVGPCHLAAMALAPG